MFNHLFMNHPNITPIILELARKSLGKNEISCYELYKFFCDDKSGIEIGGPSPIFNNQLPLYSVIRELDCVNFSNDTVWEGRLTTGADFIINGKKLGQQFIANANNLNFIASDNYDFLLSSNCLEHIANPLSAIAEWKRVLKPEGCIVLVLPNKISNFDHRRNVTSFEHLLEDYSSNVTDYDLTHLPEILELHDLSLDSAAGTLEEFKIRSNSNFMNRCLHHHVFDITLTHKILNYFDFQIVNSLETFSDFYFLAIKRI
jgi:SAM-dependent methyltransferase